MAVSDRKSEEIVEKLQQIEMLRGQGLSIQHAVRQAGISELTFYRWRDDYGGLSRENLRELKDLRTENARLRKTVSDLVLDRLIMAKATRSHY